MPNPPQLTLRSHKGMAINMKYYVPTILAAFAVAMLYGGFTSRRLLVICPALVAALFFLSLANLEVADGVLRYRRFLRWVPIEASEVRGSGVAWPGVIGYIRLHRYVVPWGKLYFVLDERRPGGTNSTLLAYLSSKKHSEDHGPPLSAEARLSILRLYLAGAIGIFTSLMVSYLTPQNLLQGGFPKSTTGMPVLLKIVFQFAGWFNTSAVQIFGAAVMALLALSRRNRPEAWLYAFLSGFALAAIAIRMLS
jgi:hypothetical protein